MIIFPLPINRHNNLGINLNYVLLHECHYVCLPLTHEYYNREFQSYQLLLTVYRPNYDIVKVYVLLYTVASTVMGLYSIKLCDLIHATKWLFD